MQWRLVAKIRTLACVGVLALSTDDEVDVRKALRDLDDNVEPFDGADACEVADERLRRLPEGPFRHIVVVGADKPVVVRRLVLPAARPGLLRVALVDPKGQEGGRIAYA